MRPDCTFTLNGETLTFQQFRQRLVEDQQLRDKYVSGTSDTAVQSPAALNKSDFPLSINPAKVREAYIARKYGTEPTPLPERVTQTLRGTPEGRDLQAALGIAGRSLRGIRPEGQKGRKATHAAEAKALKEWALANGKFIPEEEFTAKWEKGGKRGESEHQVYFDGETQKWWKRNTLNFHDGSISAYLERIAAQAYLFPTLTPEFRGFTEYKGELMPVISQAHATGVEPTEEQINAALEKRGFVPVYETGEGMTKARQLAIEAGLKPPPAKAPKRAGFYNAELGLWLEDVHEENASLIGDEVGVFDPVLYFVGDLGVRSAAAQSPANAVTPQQDADYLAAVERGDMETAQRMVDEVAKAAGYTSDLLHHGTTHLFTVFNTERANIENDFGKGFYFSSSPSDVENNYAGEGPDLTSRIERRQEQIFDSEYYGVKTKKEAEEIARRYGVNPSKVVVEPYGSSDAGELVSIKHSLAKAIARKELSGGTPRTLKTYVRLDNPAILGGPNATRLSYTFDEETGEESGSAIDLIQAARDVAADYSDADAEKAIASLTEDGDLDGMLLEDALTKLKRSEGLVYATDENGDLASTEIIRQIVERIGFDGIVDNNVNKKFGSERRIGKQMAGMDPSTYHVIAFKPESIKLSDPVTRDDQGNVIPLSQRFQSETPDIRYSPESAPLPDFYSKLQRVLETKMPNAASAQQVKAIIDPTRGSGVKPEEVKWSGVEQAIDRIASENNGKVPKAALLKYLAEDGAVKFEEVTLGGKLPTQEESQEEIAQRRFRRSYASLESNLREWVDKQIEGLGQFRPIGDSTKYSQYQLPGGSNYREVVLAMPVKKGVSSVTDAEFYVDRVQYDDGQVRFFAVTPNSRSAAFKTRSEAEQALAARPRFEQEASAKLNEETKNYTSPHFDTPNYVAHMRLNERTDATGKPGLFIEEIQSDRHQKGREKGYAGDTIKVGDRVTYLSGRQRNVEYVIELRDDGEGGREAVLSPYKDGKSRRHVKAITEIEVAEPGIPDAPFRKDWPLQMFKRALRDAVASGKDWIGWTTGDTQAARYDLSKQVSSIEITKPNASEWEVYAYIKNGDNINRRVDSIDKVAEIVGKDIAKKVVDLKEGYGETFKGNDLKVGGEGMKGFYDQILPKEISKYVKQWGAQVEKGGIIANKATSTDLPGRPFEVWDGDIFHDAYDTREKAQQVAQSLGGNYAVVANAKYTDKTQTPIWRVNITTQMREGVAQGQVLFSPESPTPVGTPLSAAVKAAGDKPPTASRSYTAMPKAKTEPLYAKALRQAKEGMPEAARKALEGKVYIPDYRQEDLDAAENFLESHIGAGTAIEDAAYLADSPIYGVNLTDRQKVLVKAIAAKRMQNAWAELDRLIEAGTATADDILLADHYKAASYPLLNQISETLTGTAQMLNLGNLIAKLFNPRALVPIGYKWPITKKQVEVIDKDKDGAAIIKEISKAKADAETATRDKTAGIVGKIAGRIAGAKDAKDAERIATALGKSGLPVTEQVKAAVVSSEIKRAMAAMEKAGADPATLDVLFKDVRRQVALQLDRWLADYGPETAPGAPPSDEVMAARFADIWDRSRLAEDAFNRAAALLRGKDPIMAAKLEGANFDITQDTGARDAVRAMVKFSQEVYKSLAQKEATRARLSSMVKASVGGVLTGDMATQISDAIVSVYDEELKAATSKRLTALKEQSVRMSKILDTTTADRLILASNIGGLAEEDVYNILAPKFNLPAWNPELAARIDAALQDVQRLPEDSLQRDEAVAKVMAEIGRAHREAAVGLEKVSHTAEVLSSFWTAGVLSGPPTHLVNATATNVSVFLENLAQATGYFFAAKRAGASTAEALKFYGDFGRALSNIFGGGGRVLDNKVGIDVRSALGYGVSRFKSEKGEALSVLEQWNWVKNPTTLKDAWNNVLSMYKYVGRAMLAADVANSVIANDTALLMRARFEAMETGLTGRQLDEHLDKVLDKTGAIRAEAVKQAQEEMDRGDFNVDLPFGDRGDRVPPKLMMARRVEQLVERAVYNAEEIDAARRFAEKATFNSDAYGLIGMMADLMSQITSKIGVTKPLIPFPRTVSNIVNQALNYTPYGFARAMNFSFSGVLASRYHSKSERGMEFLKYSHPTIDQFSPEYYAQLGRASLGTAGVVALLALAMRGLDDEKENGERAYFEVTATGPADFAQRKQLQASGTWQPNTVRIGGVRLRYTDWPALSLVLAAVGSYSDARRYNKIDEKSAGEQMITAMMGVASVTMERQMLSGLSDLFKVIGGGPEGVSSAKRLTSSYVGGFSNPQLLRWVRSSFDSTPPEQSTVNGWLLSMAPMAIGNDRPTLNILGQPVERMFFEPTTQRFADINEIIKPDPVLAPLSKAGVFLPVAKNTKITDPRTMQPRAMTGDEFYEFAKVYGLTVGRMVTPAMAQSLAAMPRDVAQKYIDDVVRPAARDTAKMMVMRKWMAER